MIACPEDLLYRRRWGALPANEEAVLEAHLRSCEPCAAEAGIAAALETVGGPQPGDELLLARVVAGAQRARAQRPTRRSPWMMAAAAGLALVVVAGLASAGIGLYRRAKHPATGDGAPTGTREAPPVTASSPSAPAASPEPQEAPRPARIAPAVTPPAAPSAPPPALGERSHPSRPRPTAPAVEPSPSLPDLKALFAAANEARRAGLRSQARELYAELQRLYPDSREARLSFVSLGRMLLDAGETAESLQQFDRYLTAAPGDVLAAEAFYGRARALTALHRNSEAQQAWSDLLSRFPDSIYADVARRQLHKVASSPN